MRINAPPPPVFTVPDSTAVQEVVTIRSVRPIGEDTGGQRSGAEAMPPAPGPEPEAEKSAETLAEERRAAEATRRAEERRKRQIPVLIDTRSGRDRRQGARRDSDPTPPPTPGSIDVKA